MESRRSPSQSQWLWPEECIECVAKHLALSTARALGPLQAAPGLATLFQVCCGWRSVSRSEILWEALSRQIWNRRRRRGSNPTWYSEYVSWHLTTSNFRLGRYSSSVLACPDQSHANTSCRCLAVSDQHVAAGFWDGSVRLFSIATKECVLTLQPVHETHLGRHSQAIAGILVQEEQVVFASLDGSIFVGDLLLGSNRKVRNTGDTFEQGVMVDFTGSSRWWVGLFAGIPGHAIRVWDTSTEDAVYEGGDLTDTDAVRGWHLLTNDRMDRLGRLRIYQDSYLLAATRSQISILNMDTFQAVVAVNLAQQLANSSILFQALDTSDQHFLLLTGSSVGDIVSARVMEGFFKAEEKGRLDGIPNDDSGKIPGAVNSWYAVLNVSGELAVWSAIMTGYRLYTLQEEGTSSIVDLVCNNRCIAYCGLEDEGIHLFDFS